ncbi:MAG: bifunctional pyr operon transcriptional regulator/uracil phosphoribosyltransferase PyrR [Opitutales bacterium]|nr:bifunctional pyr operon transcriptional regulator/uracil phosphoribosyltransferase PyrR [Opitutales bacterium]
MSTTSLIDPQAAYKKLLETLREHANEWSNPAIVGVANGGVELARRIRDDLLPDSPVGILNLTFHRDDIALKPIPKDFMATDIPFDVDDRTILLVDDVFATGRSARAALNELFDYGRPQQVCLAVLVDIDQRLLPIHPDFSGHQTQLGAGEKVHVSLNSKTRELRIEIEHS